MPILERDGAKLHYEVFGHGYPLVLFAPGGMNSSVRLWAERPGAPGQPPPWMDPTVTLAGDFQVIAMDQRNAGLSTAPIDHGDGWETYTADHLALLDHLDLDRVHVMGGCIGASYCLALCESAPERVSAAVLQNPIGVSNNRDAYLDMFDAWASRLCIDRTDISEQALAGFRQHMFGGEFVFSVDRDFVRRCPTPLLVLAGDDDDRYHPAAVACEIAALAPVADLILEWAGPEHHRETLASVRDFLRAHTPE
ncbi:MAG: alpha/beta hydrolase [Actinomycetes bacterium]